MNVAVATAADGQFQFSLTVDGNPAGEFGRTITSLKWLYEAIGSAYRISIVDNITSELFWSFSNIVGGDDTSNTLNGQSTLANVLAEVKTAWNDPGGGGGGGGGNVVVTSSALPTGAATEATLLLAATSLGLLDDVLQILATPATVPTRSLQVGGYDDTNNFSYALPVTPGNSLASTSKRFVVVGGVRNRSNASILPIIGNTDYEQLPIEGRVKGISRNTSVSNVKALFATGAYFIYGWNIINTNATDVYLRIYTGIFASIVVGTTVPALTIRVPGNGSAELPSNVRPILNCSDTITVACVTQSGDTGATAPGTPIIVQLFFNQQDYTP